MGARKKLALEQFNRDNILTAARELFETKGVQDTTMDDIALQADYSKSTIYVYFRSKEDIYNSIVVDYLDILIGEMTVYIEGDTSFEDSYYKLRVKNPEKSSRYNLLQPIIDAVNRGEMDKAEMYAWDITNILVGDNTSNEKIWENGEKSTIAAAILCYGSGKAGVAAAALMCAGFANAALYPVRSDSLNALIPSEQRATLISVDSMCFSIAMIVLFPLAGAFADRWGLKTVLLLLGAILLLFLLTVICIEKESFSSGHS